MGPERREEAFIKFPQTEAEIGKLPSAIQQRFELHLKYLGDVRNFLGRGFKDAEIGKDRYCVTKHLSGSGEEEIFSFYSESPDGEHSQSSTINLRVNKGQRQVVQFEEISEGFSREEMIIRTRSEIDLRRGVRIEQEIDPLPIVSGEGNPEKVKQKFYLKIDNLGLRAEVIWRINSEYCLNISLDQNEQIISNPNGKIKIIEDLKTGKRILVTSIGSILLSPPDQFISDSIRKVLNSEPINLQPANPFGLSLF